MKTKLKIGTLLIIGSMAIFGCKGGVTGEKSDSTMLDTQARDSAAARASYAHKDSVDPNLAKKDTSKPDTSVKKQKTPGQ